jgi:colanic acid biosynthesis glycosyl transferase WcaI
MVSQRRWFDRAFPPGRRPERPASIEGGIARRIARDSAQGRCPPAPWFGSEPIAATPTAGARVLLINQYYWPDHASTAQHLADLAEWLAAAGYECHVLASLSRYRPGEPRPANHEVHEGVHIHRVPATSLGRRGTWARMTDYLSFYAGAVIKALFLPRFDVVVTLTTPPIIGLIGTTLRVLKGTRHVYWSMDLHPDASLALRRMSSKKAFVRFLSWLSAFVYRQADRVVVLGPYMADRIALKGVPTERIVTIPVWSRRDEIYPIGRTTNPMRKAQGLRDQFVVMYSGNLGLAHSFDEFLAAAQTLRERPDIQFLFVGGGPRLAEVEAAIERDRLENVGLLDYVSRSQLHASLTLADLHLISMRPEMTGIVVPGKLYGAMAAGRPVIFVGPEHCETADTIRQAGCGITIAGGETESLARAIELLASDPSLARRMGERGRTSFVARFERRICCHEWEQLIASLARLSPQRRQAKHAAARISGHRTECRTSSGWETLLS